MAFFPRDARLNHPPHDYAQFLFQFGETKLKAMQVAFLAGNDLTPFLDVDVAMNFAGRILRGIQHSLQAEVLGALTTAVCWSLAAPDVLKFDQTSSGAGTLIQSYAVPREPFRISDTRLLDSVLQGEACDLEGWMKDWKGSPKHQEEIKTAILTPAEELTCNKNGVTIIGHADFGLKRVGWSAADVTAVPYDRPAAHYYRTLTITNESYESVVLLDVCAVPSMNETFVLHDDFGLAHHHDVKQIPQTISVSTGQSGVTLVAGAQYQVTVELRCSPQDIAWHQQWLLFMFGAGNPLQTDCQDTYVIGRRVSALIGHNIQDVQKCLSTEARPFYPAALRQLFDHQPLTYEIANLSPSSISRDWRRQIPASRQTHVSSVWPSRLAGVEEALHTRALALASLPLSAQPCPCTVRQLRQLSRLLALEEAAMERDIKDYDLFSVELAQLDYDKFILEVPGLPENRPSVFVEDTVYIRWERYPGMECAAEVMAVEFQPKPRLILNLPPAFMKLCPLYPLPILVHARFTFDRLHLTRMHIALEKVAMSSMHLLPCICSTQPKGEHENQSVTPPLKMNGGKSNGSVERFDTINKSLNVEQRKAVRYVAESVHGSGPYIILGPPGTGKTVTVVECVLQVLAKDPSATLCVCAPSNFAADILCSGIAAGGIDGSLMWRMNDPRRTMASVKVDVLPFCHFGLLSRLIDKKLRFRVIVCTCGAAGMLNEEPLSTKLDKLTHILIDEAGQALIPEALIPLSLGDANTRFVLCGDPKQLGPVVHSRLAAENGFDDTLIARFQSVGRWDGQEVGNSVVMKLIRNYRANVKLLELPSRLFYNNELIASAQASATAPPRDWDELKGRDFPMLFYGVKGQQLREGESPSYFNPVEAGKIADLISGLIAKTRINAGDIGVMAPYRRQVQKLRLVLRSKQLGAVRVGTVDDYQGQEEKIVFISTVLTRPDSVRQVRARGKNNQIGFLGNAKRFNVAITRAKALLVVVGHPLVLALDENWSELLRFCLGRDAFRGYGSEFVPGAMLKESLAEHLELEEKNAEIGLQYGDGDRDETLETAKAIEKLAELSLLGVGDLDRLFPSDLDSMYSAFSEEMEWRIQL